MLHFHDETSGRKPDTEVQEGAQKRDGNEKRELVVVIRHCFASLDWGQFALIPNIE